MRTLERLTGQTYQNWFYLNMFLVHLALGLLFVVPLVVFGIAHMRNAYNRPNRRAVRVGYALFVVSLVLLVTGVVLTRLEGIIVVKDPAVRSVAWWLHVLSPLVAAWLFVIHRLAGSKIRWAIGARWALAAVVIGAVMLVFQAQDPRQWNVEGPASGEQYFFPSLARTSTGQFIPAEVLDNNAYCVECHPDVHERWANSVHRWSSFNNPPYAFSVAETRKKTGARPDTAQGARFCAGCHDPVPFFSGRFDDSAFHDSLEAGSSAPRDPTADSGITCTVCHAITHLNSPRGNADYTIEEPLHYPFATSARVGLLRLGQRHQMVKSQARIPQEDVSQAVSQVGRILFGTCHKVHSAAKRVERLQGLSCAGRITTTRTTSAESPDTGARSFYYPPTRPRRTALGCHMPELQLSRRLRSQAADPESGEVGRHPQIISVPSGANTAVPLVVKGCPRRRSIEQHRRFLTDGR